MLSLLAWRWLSLSQFHFHPSARIFPVCLEPGPSLQPQTYPATSLVAHRHLTTADLELASSLDFSSSAASRASLGTGKHTWRPRGHIQGISLRVLTLILYSYLRPTHFLPSLLTHPRLFCGSQKASSQVPPAFHPLLSSQGDTLKCQPNPITCLHKTLQRSRTTLREIKSRLFHEEERLSAGWPMPFDLGFVSRLLLLPLAIEYPVIQRPAPVPGSGPNSGFLHMSPSSNTFPSSHSSSTTHVNFLLRDQCDGVSG